MTYETPFEKALLAEVRRTNELLEYLVMAHQPMKITLGAGADLSAEALQKLEAGMNERGRQLAEATKGVPIERALAAAGILPVRRPRGDVPETPEQRAARFTARAKEVGMSDEEAAEVSGRIVLNLDQLVERPVTEAEVVAAPLEQVAPAKRAPRKKASGTSG